jgi:hypothetical protein
VEKITLLGDICGLFCSPNIVRVIKSRGMGFAGHVARMWERRGAYRTVVGRPEEKRPLGRPGCRWGVILKWIFKNGMGAWTGLIWLRIGTGGGPF